MRVTIHAPALWRRHGVRGSDEVIDLPDAEAEHYLAVGVAVRADAPEPVVEVEPEPESEPEHPEKVEAEAAVVVPPQHAAIRTNAPAKRNPAKKRGK